jgi:hypothetical protein
MWMDDEAKSLLDQVKIKIANEGIKNPSYGDAVRRLVKEAAKA